MKCNFCHTCLTLTRIDLEEGSYLYWFCEVCGRVFSINMGKKEEIDGDLANSVRKKSGFKGEKID